MPSSLLPGRHPGSGQQLTVGRSGGAIGTNTHSTPEQAEAFMAAHANGDLSGRELRRAGPGLG